VHGLVPAKGPSVSALVIPLLVLGSSLLSAEHLPITAYTTPEGLVHNHINRIRQDSRGYLWFCTDGGLSRFDGYQFINYTTQDGLPHPWVNDLLETREGVYWIATDGGVCRFNPRGHPARQSAAEVAGMPVESRKRRTTGTEPMFVVYHPGLQKDANRVNAFAEDPSRGIWCATYAGLYRFQPADDNVAFEFVDVGLPRNTFLGTLVNNIALDGEGTLWIAARHGLFRRLRDGRSERYIDAQGLPDNFVETVFQDHGGRWWIGTRGRGFCSLVSDPEPGRRVTAGCYSTADGLPGDDVRSIFQSSTGALWIGTIGGLSEFNPSGSRFRNYTTANGLSAAVIYKIGEDRDGNLWIGSRDSGVMKMAGDGFVTYDSQDGFLTGNADAEIFEDLNGELCVITAVGARAFIERFDGTRFIATEISLPRADPRSAVHLRPGGFQDRSGKWWVATNDGLYRFAKTDRVEYLDRLRPHFIYDVTHGLQGSSLVRIYPDTRGDIWIATEKYTEGENHTENTLARWARDTDDLHHYVARDGLLRLNQNPVMAFREDASGNLWMGFDQGGGLVRYRGQRFELFQAAQEAFRGVIRNIFVDHIGRVWVASTQAGLSRIDHPASDHPQLARYTTAEGLSSNEIRCITEDRFGRIYVGTNQGVDRLELSSDAAGMEPPRVKHYTWADGLAKGTVHFAHCDRRGALWFVTNDGISRFVPGPDRASTVPPILITGVRIMGVPQPLSQLGEADVADLKLPPSRNEVEIDFLSIDFHPGADLRYQFRLEGMGEHWSTPTDQRRVHYAGLAPGAYRFLVRAVSPDGRASSRPASLSIIINKPFWRQWWFISLEAAIAALVVYGVSRYRLVQLLAVERIRTRIATDLHDDIGSSLSQVAILSEVVRQRVGESDPEINASLTRIAEVSRELVDSMSDIVWAINPAKDRLYYLAQRMREFASDVFMAAGIHFQFHGSDREHDLAIGAEMRRQVFLIFKECIHNIIRHANCTQVELELRAGGDCLVVQVRDDGVGFEPSATVHGHGLASMRDRARRLEGKIDIAADDRGTVVTLQVPLRKRRPVAGSAPLT
jgi:ligand-binding sensor domain-containing protein/signal transduction histidine kinase